MPGPWLVRSGGADVADRDGGGSGEPTRGETTRAVLLGIGVSEDGPGGLGELERLAETDGVAVVGRMVQNRDRPDPATYLGSGKVDEFAGMVREGRAALVIADHRRSSPMAN